MRLQQRLSLCFVALITLFATDALASCPMSEQGPPCQEYWRTDAVFIGVANRVVNIPNDNPLIAQRYLKSTAFFTIEEAFKGVAGTVIVFDSNACGYIFQEGERYLVYAHRNSHQNNELEVIIGRTRTRPISEAVDDLKYIRGLSSAEPGSRIFGRVAQHTYNFTKRGLDVESLNNVKVTLDGNNQRQEVAADSEGRYEFKGLLKGTYRVRAEVPTFLSYNEEGIKVNGRACVPLDIALTRKARIAGRVFDKNGETLIRVPVSLVQADASHEEIFAESKDKVLWPFDVTSLDGRFAFTQLPPGRYLLIINRTEYERSQGRQRDPALPRLFYPGVTDISGATVIVVGADDEPREYDFRLPIPE